MLKFKIIAVMVLLILAPVAHAKDVSAQQAGYNNALQKMEKAEAEYKADAQAVTDTEKFIEKKKKQLAEEQKKAEASKKILMESKEKLEQAQAALDKAWKE
jgi:hypothetical protein